MDANLIWYILAGLLILLGLAGTILPALPGLPLVFAGMLLAAWAGDFERIGIPMVVVLAVLTLFSMAVDFWATAHGAKRVGASRKALVGAVIGTFAGLFVFPPFGLFVGPFAGALIGELIHRRNVDRQSLGHAAKVGFGTWFGIVLGAVLKLGIAFAMIGLFALAWLL
jgi:uncharacterized protein YqgC (DUF456 family)